MFGETIAQLVPIAPARLFRSATNTSVVTGSLVDSTAAFLTIARKGDKVINVTDSKSAYVIKVVSDAELQLSEHIFSATAKTYQLWRPRFYAFAPVGEVEWTLQNVFTRAYPAGALYTAELVDRDAVRNEVPRAVGANGVLALERKNYKAIGTRFLVCKNFTPNALQLSLDGIDKTISIIGT